MTDYKDTKEYRKPEWVTKMEAIRAKMAGNGSNVPIPRIRLHQGSESDRSMSLDSATLHELISKCHSMGDVSTGSDSVFISESNSSRRPSLNNNKTADFDTRIPQTRYRSANDLGVASASIFAQSVLSGYLQSHRQSITAAIEAIGCPTDDQDDKTPTPSDNEFDDESGNEEDDEDSTDTDTDVGEDEAAVAVAAMAAAAQRLQVPCSLNFSTMLSPIQENGETPTSESVEQLQHNMKASLTDLLSMSSMEDLKEFLMLETLYTT